VCGVVCLSGHRVFQATPKIGAHGHASAKQFIFRRLASDTFVSAQKHCEGRVHTDMFQTEFVDDATSSWSVFAERVRGRVLELGGRGGIHSDYYKGAKYTSTTQRKRSGIMVSDGTELTIEQIVAFIHKAFRRGKSGWTVQLLVSFFAAVDKSYKEDVGKFVSKKTNKCTLQAVLAAHVTKAVNRVVVTIVEDSAIVALLNQTKFLKALSTQLVQMRLQADAKQWDKCAQTIQNIFENLHWIPRSRYPSYLKHLVQLGHIDHPELKAGLDEEKLSSIKEHTWMNEDLACTYLRPLQKLFDNNRFAKNGEFCKLIHMNAVIAKSKLVPPAFPDETLRWDYNSFVYPRPFSKEDYKSVGANDKHTGVKGIKGELEWLNKGVIVRDASKRLKPVQGFLHRELEQLYRSEKMKTLLEAGHKKRPCPVKSDAPKHKQLKISVAKTGLGLVCEKPQPPASAVSHHDEKAAKKRMLCHEEAEMPQRKQLKLSVELNGKRPGAKEHGNTRLLNYYDDITEAANAHVLDQGEVVDLTTTKEICGWKRPSAVGVLKRCCGGMLPGSKVFVKFFDDPKSMKLTDTYYKITAETGFAPRSTLVLVKYDEKTWADVYRRTNAPEAWCKAFKLGDRPLTQLMLVVEYLPSIPMIRMSKSGIDYEFKNNKLMMRTFIQEVVKSKLLGLGDLNLFNLVVSKDPVKSRVVRVDCAYVTKSRITGPASKNEPRPYNDCSFQTSQPMPLWPNFGIALQQYIAKEHVHVANIIEKVMFNYAKVASEHVRCVWFDNRDYLQRLREGRQKTLDLFMQHLLSVDRPSSQY
jgi:hypothetical protein